MNPLCRYLQMMMGGLGREIGLIVGGGRCGDLGGGRDRPLLAKLGECVLRPAALAGHSRRGRDTSGLVLAEFARRETEPGAEGAAEMGGIAEPIAVGDFGNRMMAFRRIGEVSPGALQPPLADIVAEIVANPFKQLLQVSLGNSFALRHARRRQVGVFQPAFDGLVDPVHDGRFGRTAAVAYRRRHLQGQRKKQIGEALRHHVPFQIGQPVERLHG